MSARAAALEVFAAKLAAAVRADEARLFQEAVRLFPAAAGVQERCAGHTFSEAAILFHRAALPANGYQFGETTAYTRRGLASTWRRGDAHALPFEAATPGLALLRATAHALARQMHDEARAACTRCNGLGWVVTREGGKRICGHDAAPTIG